MFPKSLAALCMSAVLFVGGGVDACTRALYQGPDDCILTGRSMDWKLPIVSNLWVFPRGLERDGAAGERSATWRSRYGSLALTGYDIATADGMNEAGLNVNLRWEVDATYPDDDGVTPRISLSIFPQHILDRYATVAEAVTDLRENPVQVAGGEVPVGPPGRAATAVFSVIRQTSVPWGISISDQPNLSTTRWRIVADQKDRRYHVESIISPSIFWVDLANLDLTEGAAVTKLDLGTDIERILSGESSDSFVASEPFAFQPAG